MFVDDEPSLLSIGRRILEHYGFSVETYEDPEKALNSFKNRPGHYDLLVTDYTMPLMTGDILAREILAVRPELPVILCTGYTEHIDEAQALAMGIKKYLKKPLAMSTLARIVWHTLGDGSLPTGSGNDQAE